MAVLHSKVQRSQPPGIRGGGISAAPEEKLGNLEPSPRGGLVQRRGAAIVVAGIDQGVLVQEDLRNCCVAGKRGVVQRGVAGRLRVGR